MKTTKKMRANLPSPSGSDSPRLHYPSGPSRPYCLAPVVALVLAMGLWTVAHFHPPIVCAAAPVSLTLKGQWPGYARGPAMSVAVQERYAYVAASSGGLVVLDIGDAAHPARVATYASMSPSAVVVSGNHAFVVGSGLEAIDIRDPANPRLTGRINVPGNEIALSGDHAYVVDWNGLQVIDVRNPAKPMWVGGYENRLTRGLTGVAVSGKYAYLSGGGWDPELRRGIPGLLVIDVSDPTNPKRMGTYESPGRTLGVAVSGDYAFLVAPEGLLVIDISNPSSPRQTGRYAASRGSGDRHIAVVGNLAYVAGHWADGPISPEPPDWKHGLQVIDIATPSNPRRVGSCDTGGEVWRLAVSGNQAFVAAQGDGLQVIDISDPAEPLHVGDYETGAYSGVVTVAGNHAFLADGDAGLLVIDISNPSVPQRLARYDPRGAISGAAVSGNYAYILVNSWGNVGLEVLQVSNRASPTRAGFLTGSFSSPLVVAGNHAYLSGGDEWDPATGQIMIQRGLRVIDLSDPANPVLIGSYNTSELRSLAVSGSYAYLAGDLAESTWDRGLQIIDVSDPSNPRQMGSYVAQTITGVAVSANYAYITQHNSDDWWQYHPGDSLLVLDVSNAANPVRVGGYDLGRPADGLTIEGRFAYVTGGGSLHVFDVSNPANPVRVGGYDIMWSADSVAVAGDLIYVANGDQGLLILEVSRPPWLEVSGINPFTFRASGEPGATLRVQRSSNLQDWEEWQTVPLGEAPVELSDPDAADSGARFFRAIQP